MTTAHPSQRITAARVLSLALDLGWDHWTVGCTVGRGQAPRQGSVRARDLPGLWAQIAQAKRRCDVATDVVVPCGSAAGRAGCWRHRLLRAHGRQPVVVEASSSEVHWRDRRSKTAQLAVPTLLPRRVRFVLGATRLWKVVRGPAPEDASRRQPPREVSALKEERTPHVKRMKGLLAGLGLAAVIHDTFPERLQALPQWDGAPVPAALPARLLRECARWALGQRQRQD
jgi:transposase